MQSSNTPNGKKLQPEVLIVSVFILSWVLLLGINFYATLSITMHLITMPILFVLSAAYAGYQLEYEKD